METGRGWGLLRGGGRPRPPQISCRSPKLQTAAGRAGHPRLQGGEERGGRGGRGGKGGGSGRVQGPEDHLRIWINGGTWSGLGSAGSGSRASRVSRVRDQGPEDYLRIWINGGTGSGLGSAGSGSRARVRVHCTLKLCEPVPCLPPHTHTHTHPTHHSPTPPHLRPPAV